MPEPWSLKQVKQCKNCPWRKDSDISEIPGYNEDYHRDLSATIVDDGILDLDRPVVFMGCHNSIAANKDLECVGWLNNQREGNNIGLRLRLRSCANYSELEVVGEQFRTFEQTLPENR
jgi:hypothetical protein